MHSMLNLYKWKVIHLSKRKTQEEFLHQLRDRYGKKVTTEDKYVTARTKMVFHCNVGMHHPDWKATPDSILRQGACPVCSKIKASNKNRFTQQEFMKRLKDKHDNEVTTSDTYVNESTKLRFHCNKNLGHPDWMASPNSVLNISGCPACGIKARGYKKTKTQDEFLSELKSVHGTAIVTKDIYTGANNKMLFQCNRDSNHPNWLATPNNILKGRGCPKCGAELTASKRRKSAKVFTDEVFDIFGDNIKVLGKYKNTSYPIRVRCETCGLVWSPKASSLVSGHGCPSCRSSSGEKIVRAILEFNHIQYSPQVPIKLRGKGHRLDIVVKYKNEYYVIQPDGKQHFKSISSWGGDDEFNSRRIKDNDENVMLPALGVHVLRIAWFWFDLNNIFGLMQDFLPYTLVKPNIDYLPMYSRMKDMVYDYLNYGDSKNLAIKYKVSRGTIENNFKKYFGLPRKQYIKKHYITTKK